MVLSIGGRMGLNRFDRIDRLCARRMQDAISHYGTLDLSSDRRDFIEEAEEEILDAINYIKIAMARGEIPLVGGAVIIHFLKGVYRMLI
jgi:hypothetical protein